MSTQEKIARIEIKIPVHGSGNVISQKEVPFDVYRIDGSYTAIPDLSMDERRIANLPPELNFGFDRGKHFSHRGNRDGNAHVILDIVNALKEKNLLK
jgi:hypothetical protein